MVSLRLPNRKFHNLSRVFSPSISFMFVFLCRKWLLCKKLSSNVGDENIISRNQPNPNEIKNYAPEENEKIVTLELTDKSPGEAEPGQDALQGNSSSSRQADSINRFRTAVEDLPHSAERHHCIRHEMDVCSRAADKYHSNYNAWSHRIWVLQNLACCCQQVKSQIYFFFKHI